MDDYAYLHGEGVGCVATGSSGDDNLGMHGEKGSKYTGDDKNEATEKADPVVDGMCLRGAGDGCEVSGNSEEDNLGLHDENVSTISLHGEGNGCEMSGNSEDAVSAEMFGFQARCAEILGELDATNKDMEAILELRHKISNMLDNYDSGADLRAKLKEPSEMYSTLCEKRKRVQEKSIELQVEKTNISTSEATNLTE